MCLLGRAVTTRYKQFFAQHNFSNKHIFRRCNVQDQKHGKLKASFVSWRPDGSAFFVSNNERDPKAFDIYRYDAKSYARTRFYKNQQAFAIGAISRDEKWVALNKTNTTLDGDVYIYDVAKAETNHLTPHTGAINFSAATFDPTSRGYSAQILYLVNHGYAVLGINNRGSSGYGKTFFGADDLNCSSWDSDVRCL